MTARKFLFIGGPLHTQEIDVQRVAPLHIDGVEPTPDDDAAYPMISTDLTNAANYVRRTVNHIDGVDGTTYKLTVYVHEGIQDAQTAQLRLGEAVAHRYFVEHGTVIDATPSQTPHRLIIPGR